MYKDFKELTQSKSFQGILIGIIVTIIGLLIFQAGMQVGQHKAWFADRLGDNFQRNFTDPHRGGFSSGQMFGGRSQPGGHGAVGKVVTVTLPSFVVASPDNLERTVLVTEDTLIREFRDELNTESIEVGKFVVVLGTPNNNGEIEAKLIRFVPQPHNFNQDMK